MTYDEFLQKLRETPRDWRVQSGCILRDVNTCPYVAVKGFPDDPIGIFKAADNVPGHNKKLRRDMLLACGLQERS